jgi:hypothetical protein
MQAFRAVEAPERLVPVSLSLGRLNVGNTGGSIPHGRICYLEVPANPAEDSARFCSDIFGWKVREREDGNLAFDDPAP